MNKSIICALMISLFTVITNVQALDSKEARIEYIGHASFRFVDVDGSSVVIDPYNSRIWLGYRYPEGIKTDAVLITHPHYDHDASYYFPENTPVYREPGVHKIGSIIVRGIATEHGFADSIRERGFLPINTVWVIEYAGKRILHLGDSRDINDDELNTLKALGPIDIVIGTGRDNVAALNATHTVPMHYRLISVAPSGGSGMETLAEIIADADTVRYLSDNILTLNSLTAADTVVAFKPMANLKPWNAAQLGAREELAKARKAMQAQTPDYASAEIFIMKAIAHDPGRLASYVSLTGVYEAQQKSDDAVIDILKRGLKLATDLDWGEAYKTHSKLASLYAKKGDAVNARRHHSWIIKAPKAHGVAAYEAAEAFLKAKD